MAGIIKKFFGKKTEDDFIEDLLMDFLQTAKLQLFYEINFSEDNKTIHINLFGDDQDLLVSKDARLLESIGFFLSKSFKNHFPDKDTIMIVDSNDFKKSQQKTLLQTVDKLKKKVLDRNRPAYVKPLGSKERRMVHQYLAEDPRVKTQSIGDGVYKKIKIFIAQKEKA